MPAILQEIPAHVRHVDHIQNAVQVKGGANWDLSRTALETPIAQVVDPAPVAIELVEVPTELGPVATTLPFRKNSVVLGQGDVRKLKKLGKADSATVVGHADKAERDPVGLALKRAEATARRLKGQIKHVAVQTAEIEPTSAAVNRKVEVFLGSPAK